jgi:hypothetical protein
MNATNGHIQFISLHSSFHDEKLAYCIMSVCFPPPQTFIELSLNIVQPEANFFLNSPQPERHHLTIYIAEFEGK